MLLAGISPRPAPVTQVIVDALQALVTWRTLAAAHVALPARAAPLDVAVENAARNHDATRIVCVVCVGIQADEQTRVRGEVGAAGAALGVARVAQVEILVGFPDQSITRLTTHMPRRSDTYVG